MRKLFILGFLIIFLGCTQQPSSASNDTLVVFHNNQGPMCLELLDWLDSNYPNLVIKEYLTTKEANMQLLEERVAEFNESQGVSDEFRYLPIIFYKGKVFSGFNEEVKDELKSLINN